jgi:fatty-acyl-CoA synthase
MIEAHFARADDGGVLNTLNTRLDADAIAFMLEHGEAKVLVTDTEYSPTIEARAGSSSTQAARRRHRRRAGPGGKRLGASTTRRSSRRRPGVRVAHPADEWNAISLNYTSGTTGNPKGVVYHHRGAYLNALSNIIDWGMPRHAVYLWTLPMFHCNGWCFVWTMAANAGVNVCLRKVEAKAIFDAIREHGVTHYCGAPIVHLTLINAPAEMKRASTSRCIASSRGARRPAA